MGRPGHPAGDPGGFTDPPVGGCDSSDPDVPPPLAPPAGCDEPTCDQLKGVGGYTGYLKLADGGHLWVRGGVLTNWYCGAAGTSPPPPGPPPPPPLDD